MDMRSRTDDSINPEMPLYRTAPVNGERRRFFGLLRSCVPRRMVHLVYAFLLILGFLLQIHIYRRVAAKILGSGNSKGEHNAQINRQKQIWEFPVLLDLRNFTWIINDEKRCTNAFSEGFKVLAILVHTRRENFRERQIIRNSFGSVRYYRNWKIILVFLLGQGDEKQAANRTENVLSEQDKLIIEEQKREGDIVLGGFIDSYRNMTYKHLMGYKWIINFCEEASLIMKIDDDIFINVRKWIDWRQADLDLEARNSSIIIPDIYCSLKKRVIADRDPSSKYFVTKEEWPYRFYPEYCVGYAYGISIDMIKVLYSVSREVKYFWLDDIFATGILMERASTKYNFLPSRQDRFWQIVMFYVKTDIKKEVCGGTGFSDWYSRIIDWRDGQVRSPGIAVLDRYNDSFKETMMCLEREASWDRSVWTWEK